MPEPIEKLAFQRAVETRDHTLLEATGGITHSSSPHRSTVNRWRESTTSSPTSMGSLKNCG